MKSREIRKTFLEFFNSKQHKIVPSAPIVLKNDPTLMFTNAGMNQFKDIFLGNKPPQVPRISDTQKCLRVSGKHNDLEEVGIDSYHHTMFEMLGNWSFGDYFKQEAIDWAYELLVDVYGLDKDRLYITVFEGDKEDKLESDEEAFQMWRKYFDADRILYCDKKDNFWEMGDVGPCGPCSEIHVDLRSDEKRAATPGRDLVNQDDPEVIEIWNLVFIQYNRMADSSLQELPAKHVDTGMGFERLCMALQGKLSNYDTDVFTPFIEKIEELSGKKYQGSYALDAKSDIAMRVIADHIRAVSFTIADGELPSNTGAGYVIRRILRRGVRYYYSFLDVRQAIMHELVPLLADQFSDVFPELKSQEAFVKKVILEEEKSFLKTLAGGLKRIDSMKVEGNTVGGEAAFELYDTYGFPIDLTRLIASEKGWKIDEFGFENALQQQKQRGREDSKRVTGDWHDVHEGKGVEFVGYDDLNVADAKVLRYRIVTVKDKPVYHVVLNKTPFYAEGGGQVGDTGLMWFGDQKIEVLTTKRENDLIIHHVKALPEDVESLVRCEVHSRKRELIENNHTATHLVHAALRNVLGEHVHQKGSLVNEKYLRFDFSHFSKVTDEEIALVERIVNEKIRENIQLIENRSIPISEAKEKGAMMLFGEKYGDSVRMITFGKDYSVELCGGCHVNNTGKLGYFKITSESAVAAGVRRIEAITSVEAEAFINKELEELNSIRGLFKNPVHTVKSIYNLQEENKSLKKEIEAMMIAQSANLQDALKNDFEIVNGTHFLGLKLGINDTNAVKTLGTNLLKDKQHSVIAFGFEKDEKAQLMILVSKDLTEKYQAGAMIRDAAKHIQGGGGGQAFFATAGGKNPAGLEDAIAAVKAMIS